MTTDDPKLSRLIARLTKMTEAGQLEWAKMENPVGWEIDLPDSNTNIDLISIDADGAPPYLLRVWDRRSGAQSDFQKIAEADSKEDRNWSTPLQTLNTVVRRQVIGADRTLDLVFKDLDKIEGAD